MKKHHLRHTVSTSLTLGLILMLSCTNWVQAQSRLAQTQYTNPISNQIVRCYNQTNIISYLVSGNDHYFVLDDNSGTLIHQTIQKNYDVNDFVVYNDYVFFCGQNTLSSSAFVGFFDINDLFYNEGSFHITEGFLTSISSNSSSSGWFVLTNSDSVQNLTKLIAFKDSLGETTVVAIGSTKDDIACVIELKLLSGQQGWNYTTGTVSQSWASNERMERICLTDNYVVTGGYSMNDSRFICFRIFHRNSLFAADVIQDTVHYYSHNYYSTPTDVYSISYPIKEFAITDMDSDRIAVFSLWNYDISSSGADGHMLSVIDIRKTLTTLGCNQVYSVSMYYPSSYNRPIYDIRYNAQQAVLYFLFTTDSPIGQYSFLGQMPYPPVANQFVTSYFTDIVYSSLDSYDANSFLIFGQETAQPQVAYWFNESLGTSSNCAQSYTIPFYNHYRFSHKKDHLELVTYTGTAYCETTKSQKQTLNIDINCQ